MNIIKQVRKDVLYHDLLNDSNIDIIEFIVMQILNISYEEVHGNCIVSNSRLSRININDRIKYSDLVITFKEYDIIIELNNNFDGNLKRNILYALTKLVKYYDKYEDDNIINSLNEEDALTKLKRLREKKRDYKKNYYQDIYKVILVNLNWYQNSSDSIQNKRQEVIHAFDNPDKGIFLKVININLDKYANMPYNQIKKEEEFYKLLTIDNYEELIEFTKDNKLLERYVSDLIKYSKESEDDDDNMNMGIELHFRDEAIYDMGVEKGIEQKEKDIVINMFKDKLPLETIKKYTKLSISKIKEIIKANN